MSSPTTSGSLYIAGHRGLVGSALVKAFTNAGETQLITRTHDQLDLTDQQGVRELFATLRPQRVIIAAAKVGGILANNTYRAQFLYENLMIASNLIDAAYRNGVTKLLFLGSSCIYPRACAQPMREDSLLSGPLELTNEPYAIAKITGVKLVENYHRQYGCNFISAMPTNLYGRHDNFDLNASHVLPAMVRKFHEAKSAGHTPVTLWGSGTPRREFLHVDDLAQAVVFLMDNLQAGTYPGELINIGCGQDLTIRELAQVVQGVVGHKGEVIWDQTKPDGTPRKLMDVSRISALGWAPRITLEQGIADTYRWFVEHQTVALRNRHT